MVAKAIDLYKLHRDEYVTPKMPQLVQIQPAQYLTITGKGEPGGQLFSAKLGALYGVAYTIKMKRKHEKGVGPDYKICKLEGFWWGSQGEGDFSAEPPSEWNWKLVIRTPDFITEDDLDEAILALEKKGKGPEVGEVTLEWIEEGECVQMLHVGPYAEEGKTFALMEQFAHEQGLSFHGLHHEVYLNDPRRVPEERLKTILRMPVHTTSQQP